MNDFIFLLVFLSLLLCQIFSLQCPDKYYYIQNYNNNYGECVHVEQNTKLDYDSAQAICRGNNGNLVTILNGIENNEILDLENHITDFSQCNGKVWIGLGYSKYTNDLQWISGQVKQYTNLDSSVSGSVSPDTGVYFDFNKNKWFIAPKTTQLCYMCEISDQPQSCLQIKQKDSSSKSGLYTIYIQDKPIEVYCDMNVNGGGWVRIQDREDGDSMVFWNKSWNDYKNGFGLKEHNFWLGNELISLFTNSFKKVQLLIQLRGDRLDSNPQSEANYWEGTFTFNLLPEFTNFTIQISDASGNATGDGWDDFSYSDGWQFSTIDRINNPYSECVTSFHMGGWWYNYCGFGSLNGEYNPPIARDKGYGFSWSLTQPARIVLPIKSRMTIREVV